MRIGGTVPVIEGLCESNRNQLIGGRTHQEFGSDDGRIDVGLLCLKIYARFNFFPERFRKGNSGVIFLDRIADQVLQRSSKRYPKIDVAVTKPGIFIPYLAFGSAAGVVDVRRKYSAVTVDIPVGIAGTEENPIKSVIADVST